MDNKITKVIDCIWSKEIPQDPAKFSVGIQKIKDTYGINLPDTYIELLGKFDGGELSDIYFPNPRSDILGKAYLPIRTIRGIALDNFWSIHNAKAIDNDTVMQPVTVMSIPDNTSFTYYLDVDILNNVQDSDDFIFLRNDNIDEVVKLYRENIEAEDDEELFAFFDDLMFYKKSIEFATEDGHEIFLLYYGDKNNDEPSIWYLV